MIEPGEKTQAPAWREALDIAGSIASVTGITLLALGKSVGTIRLGEILGWLIAASLLLAAGTAIVLTLRAGSEALQRRGRAVLAIYWLVTTPVSMILAIILVQAAKELIVPFIMVLVHGQYPA